MCTVVNFQISEVMLPEAMDLDVAIEKINNKSDLFTHMVSLLNKAGSVNSEKDFLQSLYEREDIGSTYMGNYIAIPHGKSTAVNKPTIAFCRCSEGILYESNGESGIVKIIFMLAIPKDTAAENYIKVLATLSCLLIHEEFLDKLYAAEDYTGIFRAVKETEAILHE